MGVKCKIRVNMGREAKRVLRTGSVRCQGSSCPCTAREPCALAENWFREIQYCTYSFNAP